MNNTYIEIVKLVVRFVVAWLMGALASHLSPTTWTLVNDIILKLGGTEAVILYITGTLASLGLAIWLRLKSQVHLRTALELPKGATVQDVKTQSPSPLEALKKPNPNTKE